MKKETKQCIAVRANGERCKRRTSVGDYCLIHQRFVDDVIAQEDELEIATTIIVSERNKSRIDYFMNCQDYDFKNVDLFIDYLFRIARQNNKLMSLLHDAWEISNR